MNLNEIQKKVYEEYVKNGYADFWDSLTFKDNKKGKIAELGFITTEVAEAIEWIFKDDGLNKNIYYEVGLECADIIIRTLNFMSRLRLNAEELILVKNELNILRGYLHGKTK